jgi:hypothetical protein
MSYKARCVTWAAVSLLTCADRCFAQTSIVGARTATEVIVASDSRVTNPVRPAETACKITLLDDHRGFASARLAEYRVANFNATQSALEASKMAKTVRETEFKFREATKPRLVNVVQIIRERAPLLFPQINGIFFETLFFGVDDNIPRLIATHYRPVFDKHGRITIVTERKTCPGDCPKGPNNTFLAYIGEYGAIGVKLKTSTQFKDPQDAAEKLVQLEIDKASDIVGPPIATVKINSSGVTWLRPGMCNP